MKRGFTLIELIAVVAILAVLGIIATTTISNTIRDNGEKNYNIQIENIKKSAYDWAHQHVFELPDKEGEFIIITLGQLQNDGFAKDIIRNPKNGQPFDASMKIKITVKNNDYECEIIE